ncbi:HAD family hydrolase [Myxococcus qinghaiensis]|uniref:HAD family hydrolase n=1 Tax=Myxococcus qinghaiensis TaxID=2906758 RepID=UPI0020A6E301|nr:HAD family hydrolase [Myxococcus qinghaiensis]MCP3161550.1 HAD family hydrolase [Myxococcus qinghaiensis]
MERYQRYRHLYEDKKWMSKPRAFGKYGPARPKAIFFDVDNTLVDRESAFVRYFEDFMVRFPDVFPEHRRAEALATLQKFDEQGGRDREAFCADVVDAFPTGMKAKEFWLDFQSKLSDFVVGDPKLAAWLDTLARRQPVEVVSNGFSGTQRRKLLTAGLYHSVPEGFYSSEVGVEKPDPAIFKAALKHVNREPFEVLHIGDDPVRDIVGATQLGFATCWVSHGREWPAALRPPTFTVERITSRHESVAEVIARWT